MNSITKVFSILLGFFVFTLFLFSCRKNEKIAPNTDIFLYEPTQNQDEWIITGIVEENGDGILEIPEKINNKPVTEIASLIYFPNNEAVSQHFTTIKQLSIPKTVKTIIPYTFSNMIGLEKVVFSADSQIEKLEGLFKNCKNLRNIFLPNSIKYIYAETFEACENLNNLHLPKNVEAVSANSFKNSGITTLTVDEQNKYFSAVDNILYNKEKTVLEYYPSKKLDADYVTPESVTEVSANAFYNCKALNNVDLKNVYVIRKNAFSGCENLMNITAKSLEFAEENVFNDTAWWKNNQSGEIYLGKCLLSYTKSTSTLNLSGYISIAPYAFKGNSNLHQITFDNELINIGDGAFMDCNNLSRVVFSGKARMVFIGKSSFDNNAANRFFEIYERLYPEYISNIFWQVYKNDIKTYNA